MEEGVCCGLSEGWMVWLKCAFGEVGQEMESEQRGVFMYARERDIGGYGPRFSLCPKVDHVGNSKKKQWKREKQGK